MLLNVKPNLKAIMRIIAFLFLSCSLLMCKSKDVLPTEQLSSFVVVLEGETSPKVLKKDISYELVDFKKANKTLNQWSLKFNVSLKEQKKLKAQLLNHPKVVSVFTQDQFDKINLKNGKKSKVGPIGKKNATKQ